ncbi:MAG: hypothetical protein AB8B93_09255 [Pseudomonadales bacterium]
MTQENHDDSSQEGAAEAADLIEQAAQATGALAEAAIDATDDLVAEVVASLKTTFSDIALSFIEHTPFLLAGFVM